MMLMDWMLKEGYFKLMEIYIYLHFYIQSDIPQNHCKYDVVEHWLSR